MRLRLLSTVCLFVFLSPALHAQLGLYGSFTSEKINAPGYGNWIDGGTFGAYLSPGNFVLLDVGMDLRGSFASGSNMSFDSGAIGPRVALNLHVLPLHPYVEATAGIGHAAFTAQPTSDVTKFEYQFIGGIDYTILPRIDWRVVEFSYGGLAGLNANSFHPKSLSTGIVVRLPGL